MTTIAACCVSIDSCTQTVRPGWRITYTEVGIFASRLTPSMKPWPISCSSWP
ncbi:MULTISPECIES: hypothetical protein [unclassified Luteimonas]